MQFEPQRMPAGGCVTLIGMAGAGKSTLGRLLAEATGWAQVDTDRLIEAYFGAPLQTVSDELGLDGFLAAEDLVVSRLKIQDCVVSTGGSVIYGKHAMARLGELGPVVHLDAAVEEIARRIGDCEGRGLAIRPGQSVAELYAERLPMYLAAADFTVKTDHGSPEDAARAVLSWLKGE